MPLPLDQHASKILSKDSLPSLKDAKKLFHHALIVRTLCSASAILPPNENQGSFSKNRQKIIIN